MSLILPTLMIKNEARFIERVLRPLIAVFGTAVVGDTGSTDGTLEIARSLGAHVLDIGNCDVYELTATRRLLGKEAGRLGAQWQLQVDGDELYNAATLAAIRDQAIPEAGRAGFTAMITLDEDESEVFWELADHFSRCALLPVDVKWSGEYPYDVPSAFGDPRGFFYYAPPPPYRYHALHLHRLRRSLRDDEVALRLLKQKQYAMNDAEYPRTQRFDMDAWTRQGGV